MLVVTRKPGEQLVIEPAGIRIVYLGLRDSPDGSISSQIKIGIDADPSQKISRGELCGYGRNFHPAEEKTMARRKDS